VSTQPPQPTGGEAEPSTIGGFEQGPIEAWEEQRRKPWQLYVDAELGFRNHWYPAFFSSELAEGDTSSSSGEPITSFKTLKMLGEEIFFRRFDGKVHAVQDWCLHRGVAFSRRPECYTQDTLTCWYHGFTYDMRSGDLTAVLTDPGCPLIGKLKLRTYPVEERQGIVFVFVGDIDPPPLEQDLAPGFLDERFAVYPNGWSREVACNWRPAAENGFDPAHAYIHRNSKLVTDYKIPTVLGDTDISRTRGMEVVKGADGGSTGIRLLRGGATAVWDAEIDGVKVGARFRPGEEGVLEGMVPEVSIWMPGGLRVDPFPAPGLVHFEWYVPIDEKTHRYMITWGTYVDDEAERAAFEEDVTTRWRDLVPNHFNNDDVFAREAMADFYADQSGWFRERLFGPDIVITQWRKLASQAARGVQHRGLQ
jgi:carbazole 1,9a-dioxygenase terminal dioxygenase component